MLLSAPVAAQPSVAPVDYAKPANWLCLPGRADTCAAPPAATWLNAGGYGGAIPNVVAKDPPLDCFYVYPTVSLDRGLNSDLAIGSEEKFAAQAQFARFCLGVPDVRAHLSPDDRLGDRIDGLRQRRHAGGAHRLWRRRQCVAHLSRPATTRGGRSS